MKKISKKTLNLRKILKTRLTPEREEGKGRNRRIGNLRSVLVFFNFENYEVDYIID